MGARLIVISAPDIQGYARLIKQREHGLFEQFSTQAPIEALDDPILHGHVRRDIMPWDTPLLHPAEDCIADELRAVVAEHHCGFASICDDPIKFTNDPLTRQRRVSDETYACSAA